MTETELKAMAMSSSGFRPQIKGKRMGDIMGAGRSGMMGNRGMHGMSHDGQMGHRKCYHTPASVLKGCRHKLS